MLNYFPLNMRKAIEYMNVDFNKVKEIRIRIGQPVRVISVMNECEIKCNKEEYLIADRELIDSIFGAINDYSLYAHSESIRQGFITVRGGHRIGFVGQAVVESGEIKNISNISSINIRISHQIIGVSDEIIDNLYDDGQVINTLIISPPGYGKTTMLRDIVRNMSNGYGKNAGQDVSVIDERSEIAAMYKGVMGNDLGKRTDVLDNTPKALGIILALRTMAPKVIAVDEIGSREDVQAIRNASNCGCSIVATAHGKNKEDLLNNPNLRELFMEKCFKRYVIIGKDGEVNVSY